MIKATRTPASLCPHCGAMITAASDSGLGPTNRNEPKPGDASMCLECGEFLIFDQELKVRLPNDDEVKALDADPRVQRMRRARRALERAGRIKPATRGVPS